MRTHPRRTQRGIVLLLALVALLLISAVAAALLYMTATESVLVGYQRTATRVSAAAAGGLEEGRGRLSRIDPSFIGNWQTGQVDFPSQPGQVLYILNPAAGENVMPWVPGNAFYDSEYVTEFGTPIEATLPCVPAPIVNPPTPPPAPLAVPCGFSIDSDLAAGTPLAGLAPQVPYKWIRITMLTEQAANRDIDGDTAINPNAPVFYTGSTRTMNLVGEALVYRLTALATLRGTTRTVQMDVAQVVVKPSGAINIVSDNATLDVDAGSGGTGLRIPPTTMDGDGYDATGTAGDAGCPAVPPFAAENDAPKVTDEYLRELNELRSGIVKRANNLCDQDGKSNDFNKGTGKPGKCPYPPAEDPTQTGCCTPGLWWVRGSQSDVGGVPQYRYDPNDVNNYSKLDLGAPELHSTTAGISPITRPLPTVSGGTVGAVDGATGNTTDPALTIVPPADLQGQLTTIDDAIAQTPPQNIISCSATSTCPGQKGNNYSGIPPAYGAPGDPKVVQIDGNINIPPGATFTGYGILVVTGNLEVLNGAIFNWTGIVILRGPSPLFKSRGTGQINGAFYFDAAPNTNAILDVDHVNFDLKITYSCDAISLALGALPYRILGWTDR